jgi:hypothetical protein
MGLQAVNGGWINVDMIEKTSDKPLLLTERRSKYKHKVSYNSEHRMESEMTRWCEQMFGPGGRRHSWRFGWINKTTTFYFKNSEDCTLFVLRWS